MDTIKRVIRLLRISHWSKAAFVFLGLFYADDYALWPEAAGAAFAFCLLASAVYIYNDFQDMDDDRHHPRKCYRPLVSGEVSVDSAFVVLLILLVGGLLIGWYISPVLALILGAYLLLNLAYNHFLKNIVVADVLCIALGFLLRVLAGTVGIGLSLSIWLLSITLMVSLLIALCKRRLEKQMEYTKPTRAVLKKYSISALDGLIRALAVGALAVYVAYVMFCREEAFYFSLTVPFAAIGLWRFAWLSTRDSGSDDPVSVFFSDALSRINLLCFIGLTVLALHG